MRIRLRTTFAVGLRATGVAATADAANASAVSTRSSLGTLIVKGTAANDRITLLGAGDDRFIWDPGDGSDTVEGQSGRDALTFHGSAAGEIFDASANGQRVRFTRNVGNIVMDLNDVEEIDASALAGPDALTVNDLSGTDATEMATDLGATDDGVADQIVVKATDGSDVVTVAGANGAASVLGLAARVDVAHANPAQDSLTINALAGDDVLLGGAGADTLSGQAGDDVLIGGPGQDILDGGAGDNILIQD